MGFLHIGTWCGLLHCRGNHSGLSVEGKYLYIDSLFSEIILHHRIRRAPSKFWQEICHFDARVRNGEEITEEEKKE